MFFFLYFYLFYANITVRFKKRHKCWTTVQQSCIKKGVMEMEGPEKGHDLQSTKGCLTINTSVTLPGWKMLPQETRLLRVFFAFLYKQTSNHLTYSTIFFFCFFMKLIVILRFNKWFYLQKFTLREMESPLKHLNSLGQLTSYRRISCESKCAKCLCFTIFHREFSLPFSNMCHCPFIVNWSSGALSSGHGACLLFILFCLTWWTPGYETGAKEGPLGREVIRKSNTDNKLLLGRLWLGADGRQVVWFLAWQKQSSTLFRMFASVCG